MIKRVLICAALLAAVAMPAAAQQTIFMVRHAERADAGTNPPPDADPDLSDLGHKHAASLAAVLKDAGITAVFATEKKRTQQTAAPVAKALGITVITVKATDTASVVAQLKSVKGNALVVGHSNTLPLIAKALGLAPEIKIADDEFDKLFVLAMRAPAGGGSPTVVTLHYR